MVSHIHCVHHLMFISHQTVHAEKTETLLSFTICSPGPNTQLVLCKYWLLFRLRFYLLGPQVSTWLMATSLLLLPKVSHLLCYSSKQKIYQLFPLLSCKRGEEFGQNSHRMPNSFSLQELIGQFLASCDSSCNLAICLYPSSTKDL